MRKILNLFFLLIIFLWTIFSVNAGELEEIIEWTKPKINVDCSNEKCDLQEGINQVKNTINDIEKERTFSEYVQDIVWYILTFISIIAVIYIIYAGFIILTAAWDEEKIKKTKTTILHVIIWIILIWLAYPITLFIIKALNISS